MKESQHEEPNDEGFHKFSKGPAIKKKTDVSDYVPILKFCMKKTPQTACLKKNSNNSSTEFSCCWWQCKLGHSSVWNTVGQCLTKTNIPVI